MVSKNNHSKGSSSQTEPIAEPESPFLGVQLFVDAEMAESETVSARLGALQLESPFLNVFENPVLDLDEPKNEELDKDEFFDEGENFVDTLAEEAEFIEQDESEGPGAYLDDEYYDEEWGEVDEFEDDESIDEIYEAEGLGIEGDLSEIEPDDESYLGENEINAEEEEFVLEENNAETGSTQDINEVYQEESDFEDGLDEEADEFPDEDEYENSSDYLNDEGIDNELEEDEEFLWELDRESSLAETEDFMDVYEEVQFDGEEQRDEDERPSGEFADILEETITDRGELESNSGGVLIPTKDTEFKEDEFDNEQDYETGWDLESDEPDEEELTEVGFDEDYVEVPEVNEKDLLDGSSSRLMPVFHKEVGDYVSFPSGETLQVTTGAEGPNEQYFDLNHSGNPLLDVSGRNSKKKLSNNFTAGELSRSGRIHFKKARIDPDLVECLQALRDFLVKPVVVIDGYYSYAYLKVLVKRRRIKTIPHSPHLSGQGAKIKVSGMSGTKIAKAIVIACGTDVSISVGTSTVAIYIKQPETKITSYIGNKSNRRTARSFIRHYRNLIHNKHRILQEELDKAYINLKNSIVYTKLHLNKNVLVPWEILKKAALYLRQEIQVNNIELMTEILFYTNVIKVLRYQVAFDLTKNANYGDHYWKLCKGKNNSFCINQKGDWLPNRLFKTFHLDGMVWRILKNEAVLPTFGRSAPPASQTNPLDKGSKGERKLADPKPDRPGVYITGKYEALFSNRKNKKYAGMTLCINQAGNHVEGVLSWVNRASERFDTQKGFFEIYGDVQNNGTFRMFNRHSKGNWDITLDVSGENLIWKLVHHDRGYTDVITFKPTAYHPILLSHAVAAFPVAEQKIIRDYEWFPLLTTQLKKLKIHLIDKIDDLEKQLKQALDTGIRSYERENQLQAANKLDYFIYDIFKKSGIHYSDKGRARFYFLSLLVQKKLKVDGRRTKSLLDWIQFMIENLQQNNHFRFDSDLRYIKTYLDIKPLRLKDGQKKYRYKITIDIKGAGFIFGVYHGSINIKKLKGSGKALDETFKVTFGSAGVSLTEFKKAISLDFSKSITAVGESYIEWQAPDFPGLIKIGEGSASLGPLGAGAGFVHIDGADYIPMMEALFVEGPKLKDLLSGAIDLSGNNPGLKLDSPYKDPKKIDLGFGGLVGKIHNKNLPDIDYSKEKVKNEFLANYYYDKKVYFSLGSALLTAPARQAVRIMCSQELAVLTNPNSQLRIIAHADRVDSVKRNFALSEIRAANTKQAIKDILGNKLRAKFVETSGKGETEATKIDINGDENPSYRRVDVFLNSRLVLRL